eukprot:Selendium_serpulae@DN5556_c0_g1_i3.p3
MATKWPYEELSLFPADKSPEYQLSKHGSSQEDNLLSCDVTKLIDYIGCKLKSESGFRRADIVVDNAGLELLLDLLLAEALLSSNIAHNVVFHVKHHPTFVSDALEKDVETHIKAMADHTSPAVASVGHGLQQRRDAGHVSIHSHCFWTQCLPMTQMQQYHPTLHSSLARESDLCVIKGDANYRRLLADRHWPLDTDFQQICTGFPTSVIALRTLKSEVAVGITTEAASKAFAADPDDWMISGKYGVLQFAQA